MKSGVAEFSKAAKVAYGNLSVSDREKLKEPSLSTVCTEGGLTKKRIKQEGAKIFRKIQSLVRNWMHMCRTFPHECGALGSAVPTRCGALGSTVPTRVWGSGFYSSHTVWGSGFHSSHTGVGFWVLQFPHGVGLWVPQFPHGCGVLGSTVPTRCGVLGSTVPTRCGVLGSTCTHPTRVWGSGFHMYSSHTGVGLWVPRVCHVQARWCMIKSI